MNNVDNLYLSRSVAPTANWSQGLTVTQQCHLPDDVQKYLWIQETTGKVWISLKQNIIDTAVNEWKKVSLCLYLHNGLTFRAILPQAVDKQNNFMKCQPMYHKCKQNVLSCVI